MRIRGKPSFLMSMMTIAKNNIAAAATVCTGGDATEHGEITMVKLQA